MTENQPLGHLFNNTLDTALYSRCMNMSETLYTRRVVELSSAAIGGVLSTVDLSVLIYLQCTRKKSAIDFLLTIGITSLLVLFFYGISMFPDLCWFGMEYSGALRFWHDYMWIFIVNTLFCAYGYLVVVLIVDKYISLHYPFFYRISCVRNGVKIWCIMGCLLIGALCNVKWILLGPYSSDDAMRTQARTWFKVVNGLSCIVQYFFCGMLMIWFSYKNCCKSRELNRDQGYDGKLGIIRITNQDGQRAHEVVARICITFTVTFIVSNWPNGVFDFLNNPHLNNNDNFLGTLFIFIKFNQTLYMQENLLIFAYSSRLYRNTLIYMFKYPFITAARCFKYQQQQSAQSKISNKLCDSATIDLFTMLCYCS